MWEKDIWYCEKMFLSIIQNSIDFGTIFRKYVLLIPWVVQNLLLSNFMYLYIINLLECIRDAIYQIIIDWRKEEDDGEGEVKKYLQHAFAKE